MHKRITIGPVENTFKQFLDRAANGASVRSIAVALGMDPSTLGRQLRGDLKVQTVVSICRVYKASLLDAFVAVEFITVAESKLFLVDSALSNATDRQLAEEMFTRAVVAEMPHGR